ncbi:MAG TPA: DinB family protein [Bryobacteraceae bacterium]|nr:DinB family protein [Bryobacteraceae bacterium]
MIRPPEASEYLPYYHKYISMVKGDDLIPALETQIGETLPTLRGISEEKSLHRYAPGKWSIKEVLGHLTDGERVFSYRAMRFARNDQQALLGFEQDDYVAAAGSDARPWSDLIAEFEHVRRASILLFRGFPPEAGTRSGTASNASVSVRALGYIIAGHELHHMAILRERYL